MYPSKIKSKILLLCCLNEAALKILLPALSKKIVRWFHERLSATVPKNLAAIKIFHIFAAISIIVIINIYIYYDYMKREKIDKTDYILQEAFKLFLSKEYVNVTTGDLEDATGITRGSIYYRTKNKEGLYKAVIDKFIFDFLSNTLNTGIPVSEKTPFWSYIDNELNNIEHRMKLMKENRVDTKISAQYVNLLVSASFHYNGFKGKYNEIERLIHNQWLHYYDLGVKCGELSGDVDSELAISFFRSLYYGESCLLSITGDGLNVQELRKKYILIYNAIKY